jgi:hypothetical protein
MTSVRGPFHAGEIAVQRRAGVVDEAGQVGRIIADRIPPGLAPIVAEFRLAVAASIDAQGRVWASLLTGPAGFLQVLDETRLRLEGRFAAGDPLPANLAARPEIGLLVFDPEARRRARFNGKATLERGGGLVLEVDQVYGNCRKYIQSRRLREDSDRWTGPSRVPPAPSAAAGPGAPARAPELSAAQQARIAAADTFFIASAHPEGGADASHRGGRPGFVHVGGARSLSFPDYAGNNMFNTLGNLAGDPRAGLLFVDFESGDLLQITGQARPVWEREAVLRHRGARHVVVEYDVDEVIDTPAGSPLRWDLVEPSPFNP